MNRPFIRLAATALPLVFGSAYAFGSDLPFQVPVTARAAQTSELLGRAAHAIDLKAGGQISNLWVFPTSAADTVFVRYTLDSGEYLSVITLEGDRIVSTGGLASPAEHQPHWSASIGAGLFATRPTGAGAPSSPHWSAKIGTGQAASDTSKATSEPVVAATQQHAPPAKPHWSSNIGTARTPGRES